MQETGVSWKRGFIYDFGIGNVRFRSVSIGRKLEFLGNVDLFCDFGIGNVRSRSVSIVRNSQVSEMKLAGNVNVPFC